MGKFGKFAPGYPSKVERAKFENMVKDEIEKQVAILNAQMEEQYEKEVRAAYIAIRGIYEQYQADVAAIALNNLGWGKVRIDRFYAEWDEVYNTFLDALTGKDEADYMRSMLDAKLQRISGDEKIPSFEERYKYLPEIKYDIVVKETEEEEKNNG